MAKKKRHSRVEIATKLAQANGLATQGKLQSEIARTLGVSVMTLHRWRKTPPVAQPAHGTGEPGQTRGGGDQIAELQLENSRLRRLVTCADLEMLFPSVPWRDPIRISDFDGNFEFACRFCIACYGIGSCDIPSLSMSAREVRRHIGEHHPWSVGHKRIRRKRLRR
jgi:putative transposase